MSKANYETNADIIIRLSNEYEALTGYLYTSRPGDGQTRVVFGDRVGQGTAAGVEYIIALLLAEARAEKKG